jgi:hypothetical protein
VAKLPTHRRSHSFTRVNGHPNNSPPAECPARHRSRPATGEHGDSSAVDWPRGRSLDLPARRRAPGRAFRPDLYRALHQRARIRLPLSCRPHRRRRVRWRRQNPPRQAGSPENRRATIRLQRVWSPPLLDSPGNERRATSHASRLVPAPTPRVNQARGPPPMPRITLTFGLGAAFTGASGNGSQKAQFWLATLLLHFLRQYDLAERNPVAAR